MKKFKSFGDLIILINMLFIGLGDFAFASKGGDLVMVSYNAENLFDTKHDPGYDDYMFLPLTSPVKQHYCQKKRQGSRPLKKYRECMAVDWSKKHLAIKLAQINRAVLAAAGDKLPDFLAVTEVENDVVATQLADIMGYKTFVMTKGHDPRGIDQALFFKETVDMKFLAWTQHAIKGTGLRPILEARFQLQGRDLYVLVNHWPSQRSPLVRRQIAAKELRRILIDIEQKNPHAAVLATGDFNLVNGENAAIAAILGATKEGGFRDLDELVKAGSRQYRRQIFGSYFYKGDQSWSRFDRFYVNDAVVSKKKNSIKVIMDSYQIFAAPWLFESLNKGRGLRALMIPRRYDFSARFADFAGFSDHLPIVVHLSR